MSTGWEAGGWEKCGPEAPLFPAQPGADRPCLNFEITLRSTNSQAGEFLGKVQIGVSNLSAFKGWVVNT